LREFETELYFPGKEDASEAQMSEAFHLQREATARSAERQCLCDSRARFALLFATLLGAAGVCPAQDRAEKANERLQEVVIQAKRQAADEEVTRQVQKTLTNDPWIYAEHVIVTTQNGVVRLEGIVGDTGERFRILRLCRKIPGTRRVIDALEIINNDADGG
jgi:osmotically-inducible protein OsmY